MTEDSHQICRTAAKDAIARQFIGIVDQVYRRRATQTCHAAAKEAIAKEFITHFGIVVAVRLF